MNAPSFLKNIKATHRLWYIPITLVIVSSQLVFAVLAYGVYFARWFPSLSTDSARQMAMLYCVGCLGAAMYASAFFARDYNYAWYQDDEFKLPTCLDWIGYLSCILGGGAMGIVVNCAVRAGVWVTTSTNGSPMRTEAAVLLAFAGGLSVYRLRSSLSKMMERLAREKSDGVEPAQPNPRAKNASKSPVQRPVLTDGDLPPEQGPAQRIK
jgi:hypothetical protein